MSAALVTAGPGIPFIERLIRLGWAPAGRRPGPVLPSIGTRE